ncbi:AcaB family transcriptional regulator [Klebsiella quasivariicola]|uniref:AcaB family transcriptional regulator n=1 Tax=Klebsiella quasivariicola TaxID=2026240 RepID=UPI001CCCE470|nr:AcaB family transcriptional regulator [Klebsiella quasivariicola]MBZ9582936.1 TIGR03761 family integrating conjugative element protein [Klebsiella quasivariicola]
MANDNTPSSPAPSRRNSPRLLSQLPAVQTGPGITITSRDALLFWENHRLRWRLTALSRLWQTQKNDNPWADQLLWQLDSLMSASRTTLVALQTRLDTELAGLPPGVVLTTQDFSQGVSPGNIASCPPVGFFVMLLGLFDRALLTLLQVRMAESMASDE